VNDVVISAENVGKKYRLGASTQSYNTLRESVSNFAQAPLRLAARGRTPSRRPDFWALRDLNLEVRRGEVLGIIGHNGAGKSTLLKLLSEISEPSEGRIRIRGRVASLLEVGTGFHPELTGRENLYLNGAILGMRKEEISAKFDEIVSFAEVERFVDTPVKHYSSGMYLRLAFSVAAHLEPDILLVDEVLAVGDASFQKKCLGKMGTAARSGRTVLLVSHNMGAIQRLCQTVVWLDGGRVRGIGRPSTLIRQYLMVDADRAAGERQWGDGIASAGVDEFSLLSARTCDTSGAVGSSFEAQTPWWVEIRYRITCELPFCRVGILLTAMDGTVVTEAYDIDDEQHAGRRAPGEYITRCRIPGQILEPGHYLVSINAGVPGFKNLATADITSVVIQDTYPQHVPFQAKREGFLRVPFHWERDEARQSAQATRAGSAGQT
jgi:lipopolysaccharide transport system ATP-binding protein